ncbi:MAG: TatD family hydrolase [Rhodospirillales bacterium]|nr:TatD family hydrolase [Rhodospirillales bacterium]
MLVDSHCHLDFPDFEGKTDEIIARAVRAGVGMMLTIGTHISKHQQVLSVAQAHDNVFCTVGIHPHEAAKEKEVTVAELLTFAENENVVGFGETGLDFFYEHSPRAEQEKQFRTHIEAAREGGLPVIVHTRDADDDTMRILEEEYAKGPFTGLIHCFSSSKELADKALKMGFYISVSGIVTFKAAEELRDTVSTVPLDRLLVETDAPFLAPVPKRGKTNEPAFTAFTAAKVAELKGVDESTFAKATTDNFLRLFSKVKAPETLCA